MDASLAEAVLVDSTEPLFVWAVTVVFSSAEVVVLVASDADEGEVDDEDEVDDEVGDEVGAPAESAVVADPASDVELDGAVDVEPDGLCDPVWPAELDDAEEAEEAEVDDPESSARALATSGAVSDAPKSAALTPADAAPMCNHRRTPKFSARRPDPLADRPFA